MPNTDLSTDSINSKTFDKPSLRPSDKADRTLENENGNFLADPTAQASSNSSSSTSTNKRKSPARHQHQHRRAASKSSVSSAESFKSSRSRLTAGGGGVTEKSSPGRGSSQPPHKIGQSKRRSREMIKQLS